MPLDRKSNVTQGALLWCCFSSPNGRGFIAPDGQAIGDAVSNPREGIKMTPL
jgi:hypothetical protein